MKLKDTVKITAMYLGRDDVISYLDSDSGATLPSGSLELLNNLTRCANLVINELSLSYIPMCKEETLSVENNKIYFSSLTETVIQILDVFDDYGESVPYKVFPEYVEVFYPSVKVRYRFLPSNYGLTDEIGYSEGQVPSRIIAYGTASEICLSEKGYQESLMWRNRFNDALSSLLSPKNGVIKARRFFQ